ncbi:hypothetical protein GCM10009415_44330 [Chitinophaga japonensis]
MTLALLLSALHGQSQGPVRIATDNPLKTRMDTLVQGAAATFMQDPVRVGLSIGIIRNGEIYTYNYGAAEKGKDVLPDSNTIYEIGSISKTFTGLLLAGALADGKIKLEDDIRRYLPGSYPNLACQRQPVRIVHLANHTAGLPPFLPDRPDIFRQPADSIPFHLARLHNHYTKEQLLKDLHAVKIDTVPGIHYRYSNAGAQLIGFILERVYHQTFDALIRRYITGPLAMRQTGVVIPADTITLAKGYDAKGSRMPYIPAIMKYSGGMYASVSDMLRYIRFQLNEKNDIVRLSHSPTQRYTDSSGIGLYWRLNETSGKGRKIWHTGGTFGFSSYCVLYPEINTGIVLLSNEFDPASQGSLIAIAEKIWQGLERNTFTGSAYPVSPAR